MEWHQLPERFKQAVKDSLEKKDVVSLEQSDEWVHPATKKRTGLVLGPPLATHAYNDSGPSTTFL